MNHRRHAVLRSFSLMLALAFAAQEAALAAPVLPAAMVPVKSIPEVGFVLPDSVAAVEDGFNAGAASRTVFMIQDAHTNESGQMNEAKVLDILLPAEKISHVFTEGADRDVSLDFLKPYFTPESLRETSLKFVRRGVMKGTEYANLNGSHSFKLLGVEDPALYDQALVTFVDVMKRRDKAAAYLDRLTRTSQTLKASVYSDAMKTLDAKQAAYRSGELAMTDYFQFLRAQAKQLGVYLPQYRNLAFLNRLSRQESRVDFVAASAEQRAALKTLPAADQKLLAEASKKKHSPFRLGGSDQASDKAFYALLEEKLGAAGLKNYPALSRYFAYLRESRKLNARAILDELEALEQEVFVLTAASREEKLLALFAENLEQLSRMMELKLTPDEFDVFRSGRKEFDIRAIGGFFNRQIADLDKHYDQAVLLEKDYDQAVRVAREFYELTYRRDEAFVEKMLGRMDADGARKAVLVTGGYHTPNLKRMFQERGISYVTILPQVLHETDLERYQSIVMKQYASSRKETRLAVRAKAEANAYMPAYMAATPDALAAFAAGASDPEAALAAARLPSAAPAPSVLGSRMSQGEMDAKYGHLKMSLVDITHQDESGKSFTIQSVALTSVEVLSDTKLLIRYNQSQVLPVVSPERLIGIEPHYPSDDIRAFAEGVLRLNPALRIRVLGESRSLDAPRTIEITHEGGDEAARDIVSYLSGKARGIDDLQTAPESMREDREQVFGNLTARLEARGISVPAIPASLGLSQADRASINSVMLSWTPAASGARMTYEEINARVGFDSIPGYQREIHQPLIDTLIEYGQEHLFDDWAPAGEDNEQKMEFIEQLEKVQNRYIPAPSPGKTYPKGLRGYLEKHRDLVQEWRTPGGDVSSPLHGATLQQPDKSHAFYTMKMGLSGDAYDPAFKAADREGRRQARKLAVVLVAGGKGNRLGYNGIKLAIPTDSVLGISNLEKFASTILDLQRESNLANGTQDRIPFYIMTSEDNHEITLEYLEENNYFGLQKDQVVLMPQDVVPAIVPKTGKMVRDPKNKYKLKMGPHGHGDIHQLMYREGYTRELQREGRYVVFQQDTNPQGLLATPAALARSIENRLDFNFITVSRKPKEALGSLTDAVTADGSLTRGSVEYTAIDQAMKAAGKGGDVEDPSNPGFSPFPGNINVLMLSADTWHQVCEATDGVVVEMVKPSATKGEDDEVRIENQMQDFAFLLKQVMPDAVVGITDYTEKIAAFIPVKMSPSNGADAQTKKKINPDTQGTQEADYQKLARHHLRASGAKVDSQVVPFEVKFKAEDGTDKAYTFDAGNNIVVLGPEVDLEGRIHERAGVPGLQVGGNHSVLALRGKNIDFENVSIDGGVLIAKVPDGYSLRIHDMSLKGQGWKYRLLDAEEWQDRNLSVRGYTIDKSGPADMVEVDLQDMEPGDYELTMEAGQAVLRPVSTAGSRMAVERVVTVGIPDLNDAALRAVSDIAVTLADSGVEIVLENSVTGARVEVRDNSSVRGVMADLGRERILATGQQVKVVVDEARGAEAGRADASAAYLAQALALTTAEAIEQAASESAIDRSITALMRTRNVVPGGGSGEGGPGGAALVPPVLPQDGGSAAGSVSGTARLLPSLPGLPWTGGNPSGSRMAEIKPVTTAQFRDFSMPFGESGALEDFGLRLSSTARFIPLVLPEDVDALSPQAASALARPDSLLLRAAILSSSQVLGASVFTGQKGDHTKLLLDAGGVYATDKYFRQLTENDPNLVIVVIADEGNRDGSESLPVYRVYRSGESYNSITTRSQYEEAVDIWKDDGLQVIAYAGDAVDGTSEAAAGRGGSLSVFSFTSPENYKAGEGIPAYPGAESDTKLRYAGYSFSASNDAEVDPLGMPETELPKIARQAVRDAFTLAGRSDVAEDSNEFTAAVASYLNTTTFFTLGPRDKKKAGEAAEHRHQRIIDSANRLRESYPGLRVETAGDGDVGPRAASLLGTAAGRHIIVAGRSGTAETRSLRTLARSTGGQLVTRYVSEEGTNNGLTPENAVLSGNELTLLQELGAPSASYDPQALARTNGYYPVGVQDEGVFAMTSLTGLRKGDTAGLAEVLNEVVWPTEDQPSGEVTTRTLVAGPEGVYVVELKYQIQDLPATLRDLRTKAGLTRTRYAKALRTAPEALGGLKSLLVSAAPAYVTRVEAVIAHVAARDYKAALSAFEQLSADLVAAGTSRSLLSPIRRDLRVLTGELPSVIGARMSDVADPAAWTEARLTQADAETVRGLGVFAADLVDALEIAEGAEVEFPFLTERGFVVAKLRHQKGSAALSVEGLEAPLSIDLTAARRDAAGEDRAQDRQAVLEEIRVFKQDLDFVTQKLSEFRKLFASGSIKANYRVPVKDLFEGILRDQALRPDQVAAQARTLVSVLSMAAKHEGISAGAGNIVFYLDLSGLDESIAAEREIKSIASSALKREPAIFKTGDLPTNEFTVDWWVKETNRLKVNESGSDYKGTNLRMPVVKKGMMVQWLKAVAAPLLTVSGAVPSANVQSSEQLADAFIGADAIADAEIVGWLEKSFDMEKFDQGIAQLLRAFKGVDAQYLFTDSQVIRYRMVPIAQWMEAVRMMAAAVAVAV